MSAARHDLARAFLTEAVYRSRNSQGLSSVFAGKTNCGLGEGAVTNLDLSPKAQELFDQLWPSIRDESLLDEIRTTTRTWVERCDALDRDRNHFLRDFRQSNGFDRSTYTPNQLDAYEAGLKSVNAIADTALGEAATHLLREE
jgi:hypothetical protein